MKSIYFLFLGFIVLLYSCGSYTPPRQFYGYNSATMGAIKSYTVRPTYKGKKEKAFYISTNFNAGKQTQDNKTTDDVKKSGAIYVHRSITDKHYNFHYGIGTTFGQYEFGNSLTDIITEGEKKGFYTVNFKTGINYKLSTKRVDFRIIGFELVYHHESGSYQKKISELPIGDIDPGYSNITVNSPKSILDFNFNTEMVFKINDENNIGIGAYFGRLSGGTTFFYTHKNITFSLVREVFNNSPDKTSMATTTYGLTFRLPNKKSKKKPKIHKEKILRKKKLNKIKT